MKKLDELLHAAGRLPPCKISVAGAADVDVLLAVKEASKLNLADFILYGNVAEIEKIAKNCNLNLNRCELRQSDTETTACRDAVRSTSSGESHLVMKGLVSTRNLLKAVLDPEFGLRKGTLSHVSVFEIQGYDRLIFVTDPAMNIAPDLKTKADIIRNAVDVCQSLGIDIPKVAPLAAVEVVNPDMPSTLDAAALTQMGLRNQLGKCAIDGPLALDNAVDPAAASHKGIHSPIAGKADILLVPNIEAGNILYKSLVYFAKAKVAAIVVGGKTPVILTSRADSHETKLYSIALGVIYAARQK
jgi:phosphate butyryltransferase